MSLRSNIRFSAYNGAVAALPRTLTSLSLWNDDISDAEVADLPRLLKKLSLPTNNLITDITNLPPALEELDFPDNTLLTTDALLKLPATIKRISINTQDINFENLAKKYPHLRLGNSEFSSHITDYVTL